MKAPVFIIGVGRSGTSYLLSLINSAPDVHLSFEGRMLKEGINLSSKYAPPLKREAFDQLMQTLITAESETTRNAPLIHAIQQYGDELYAQWTSEGDYARLMWRIYQLAFGQTIWGDKVLRVEYAPDILRIWPDARFIITLRDPRAVYQSQKAKWHHTVPLVAGYWNTHLRLSRQLQADYPQQVTLLQYENLVRDSATVLNRLFTYIDPSLAGRADAVLQKLPPQPASLDKWRNAITPDEQRLIEGYCYTGMVELGYTPQLAEHATPLSTWVYLRENISQYSKYLFKPQLLIRKNAFKRLRVMLRNRQ